MFVALMIQLIAPKRTNSSYFNSSKLLAAERTSSATWALDSARPYLKSFLVMQPRGCWAKKLLNWSWIASRSFMAVFWVRYSTSFSLSVSWLLNTLLVIKFDQWVILGRRASNGNKAYFLKMVVLENTRLGNMVKH